MGVKEFRAGVGARIDAAYFLGEITTINKNGKPRAELVGHDWFLEAKALMDEKYAAKRAEQDGE